LIRDRIKFIRLLKEGLVSSQLEAGKILNISERHSQRLWRNYREKGLDYLRSNLRKGKLSKLNNSNLSELEERLKESNVKDLLEVKQIIEDKFGVIYTISGISKLFSRHKIKLKTGRPSNILKDTDKEIAFKKTFQI
ncbi:transposase, partial [bacterium]